MCSEARNLPSLALEAPWRLHAGLVLPPESHTSFTWVYSQQTQVLGLAPDCSPCPGWPSAPTRKPSTGLLICLALTHLPHPHRFTCRTSHCRHPAGPWVQLCCPPFPFSTWVPSSRPESLGRGASEFRPGWPLCPWNLALEPTGPLGPLGDTYWRKRKFFQYSSF